MSLRGIESARRRKASHSHPAALMRSHLRLTCASRHPLMQEQCPDDGGLHSRAMAARGRLDETLHARKASSASSTQNPDSSSALRFLASRLRHGCSLLQPAIILPQAAHNRRQVKACGDQSLLKEEKLDEATMAASSASKQDLECPICLDFFSAGQSVIRPPCAHTFHTGCLLPWIEAHPHCPACRHLISTQ